MNSPLVSIIIPLFNRFLYTNRAIDSVLNQTYKYWELIIIDDCSNEEFKIYTKYRNSKNIFLLRNNENLGSGLSRQRGLDLAKGKYVAFLDSDDFYHEDFLLKMVGAMENSNSLIGVYCFSQFTSDNSIKSEFKSTYILPTLFDLKRPWTTCSWLWDKSKIGVWQNLRTNQDSLFEIDNAMKNNNVGVVPEVLCFIDKTTSENTIDLVGNDLGELNRNFVANYAFDNIDNFKKHENYNNIKSSILKRMIFVSAKLAGIGEKGLVFKNGKKLLLKGNLIGIIILFFSFFIGLGNNINLFIKNIIHKFG